MFRRHIKTVMPNAWSSELWKHVGGTDVNFHALLLIEGCTRSVDVNFGERSPKIERSFFGKIALSNSESKNAVVPASLNFHTGSSDQAQSRIPLEAVGWVHTVNLGSAGNDGVSLSVNLRCSEKIVQAVEEMVTAAKVQDVESLPVWLWGTPRSASTTDGTGAFAVIQPLTRCMFEQSLRLAN